MRRQAVVVMRSEAAVSERRACGLMGMHRATCRYQRRRCEDPRLRERLRELAAERRRFGYRRLTKMLVREGWKVNHKRVYRLYLEEKLSLRRKRGRRRRAGSRLVLPPKPTCPGQLWTMDFASDAFTSGRKFRTLNLMDGFTREALEIEPDTSLPGARVVRVLEGLRQQGRKPEVIVIDNGPEFISQVVDQWAYENGVQLHFITPGRPMENGYRELQRQVPRRVPERELVLRSGGCAAQDRRVEVGLQPRATTLGVAIPDTHGVRSFVAGRLLQSWTGARDLKRRPLAPDPHPRYAAGRTKTGESLIIPGLKMGGRSLRGSLYISSNLTQETAYV